MYFNFKARFYNGRLFPHPDFSVISLSPDPLYPYSVDIAKLPEFGDAVQSFQSEYRRHLNVMEISEDEFICSRLKSDFIFDNQEWGAYYPNYEAIVENGSVSLRRYNFITAELPALERRIMIESHIAEGVKFTTELKGIRQALYHIIDVLGEQNAVAVQDFIRNDQFIRKQIARTPKNE